MTDIGEQNRPEPIEMNQSELDTFIEGLIHNLTTIIRIKPVGEFAPHQLDEFHVAEHKLRPAIANVLVHLREFRRLGPPQDPSPKP